jgi:hypothetical protein
LGLAQTTVRPTLTSIAVALILAATHPAKDARAQRGQTSLVPNDYSQAESWLCRPDRATDACHVDLTTTVVAADGTFTREAWTPTPDAPIDCFYVYPTVSAEPGMNADMRQTAAEFGAVRAQFARFGSVCRLYAPMYRQVTLGGLRQLMTVRGQAEASFMRGLAFDDVRDAWRYYLEHDNHGRGVVLIGHSQGSFVLTELIREEIDGMPSQSRLVSAILAGATVPVPTGKDVGGAFQHVPLCHAATDLGCAIVFSSFRSTVPPPADTLFGHVELPGMTAACVNPAAMAGGKGELHTYFLTRSHEWTTPARPVDTPFVSVPGLVTARCATNANANYLEITVHGDASDPRTDDIPGDLVFMSRVQPNWGLHTADLSLTIGNLVDIVRAEGRAFIKRISTEVRR